MKLLSATVLVVLLSIGLTGCNTAKGVGQDVQATGENIENAADKAHEKISQ